MNEKRKRDSETLYWTLIGHITADNELRHLPGILTKHPYRLCKEDQNSPFRIELLSQDNHLLVSHRVLRLKYTSDSDNKPIRAKVPFHPKTQVIRFWNGQVLLKEWNRPDAEPVLDQLSINCIEGNVKLTWQASHPSDAQIQFVVRLSQDGGKTFNRISDRLEKPELEISKSSIPGGKGCIFQVAATDGVNTTTIDSEPIDLQETAAKMMITSPQDGQHVGFGQSVLFSGQILGFIGEDTSIDLVRWISDRDGEIGHIPMFTTSSLSMGMHQIRLTAQDSKKRELVSVVTIHVIKKGYNKHSLKEDGMER